MEEENKVEMVNENDVDNINVKVIKKCAKCGQLLDENAKDCWKCSSKDLVEEAVEITKELEENEIKAKLDRLESEVKNVKTTNSIIFILIIIIALILFLK